MTKSREARRRLYLLLSVSLLAVVIVTGEGNTAAAADTTVQVTVDAQSSLGTLPETAFGINASVWDGHLLDAGLPALLSQAGTTTLRYPGGSTADVYHWQTNSITQGQDGYADPNNTFDAFMGLAKQTSAQTILTVNYGSNAAGTAGGDPQEAAAWVKYANITKHYGVHYWEIGNEVYGNGTYGSKWEVDLHQEKGPAAYAKNALTFIHAMKAVDPSIQVGVVLAAPGRWPDGMHPDWNQQVLALACQQIDFVNVHWYPQDPGNENDAGLLNSTNTIGNMVATLRALMKQNCGARASQVEIMVTETNSVSFNPGKQTVGPVNALFLADNYMNWLEHGVANVDWWDIHNSITTGQNVSASLYGDARYGDYGVLSSGESAAEATEPTVDTPLLPYYGLQMLTKVGRAGDQMVSASSTQPLLAVHAVKQKNGQIAILLINKNPTMNYHVAFSFKGYASHTGATIYTFGKDGGSIAQTQDPAFGDTQTEDIPPYSLVTLTLAPPPGGGS
jgi:hypothetical protein